jgi:hypothetical protein
MMGKNSMIKIFGALSFVPPFVFIVIIILMNITNGSRELYLGSICMVPLFAIGGYGCGRMIINWLWSLDLRMIR